MTLVKEFWKYNPDCCGSGPHSVDQTVKLMPYGGEGNLILCHMCWIREIAYRHSQNKRLGVWAHFQLPSWATAKVYDGN